MSISLSDVRVVEASRGTRWWAQGWQTFTSNLWTWIGIMVIYFIIIVLISVIPFVGDVGHSLLAPVFFGGLMLGCRAIHRGEPLRVAHLFEGFQGAHFVPLLIIGAIDIGLTLLIAAIVTGGVFGGTSMMDTLRSSGTDPFGMMSRSMATIGFSGFLAMLAGLLIAAVMGTLNWFAPALVVLHGAKSIDAMKTSFVTCWRNWLPFLVYGLVAIAVMLVVGAIFVAVAIAFFWQGIAGSGEGFAALIGLAFLCMMVFALAALVIGPVAFGSTYAAYRDTLASDDVDAVGNPANN